MGTNVVQRGTALLESDERLCRAIIELCQLLIDVVVAVGLGDVARVVVPSLLELLCNICFGISTSLPSANPVGTVGRLLAGVLAVVVPFQGCEATCSVVIVLVRVLAIVVSFCSASPAPAALTIEARTSTSARRMTRLPLTAFGVQVDESSRDLVQIILLVALAKHVSDLGLRERRELQNPEAKGTIADVATAVGLLHLFLGTLALGDEDSHRLLAIRLEAKTTSVEMSQKPWYFAKL